MNRIFVSAAHKSSGKTTVCIGLCAALRARGASVQPFKKGPDYIDPLWLGLAAGRPCYSLDAYLMGEQEIRDQVARAMRGASIAIVEGNKGLYDGLDLDGGNSNAAMAALLGTPVVLVIDARGMTRGIAPLILGYQAFDRNIRIAGVILNQLGGPRHEAKLRAVIEHYTGVPVLGAVFAPLQDVLYIGARELGAWKEHDGGRRPISTAEVSPHQRRLRVVASRRHAGEEADACFKGVGKRRKRGVGDNPTDLRCARRHLDGERSAKRVAEAETSPAPRRTSARILIAGGVFPIPDRLACSRARWCCRAPSRTPQASASAMSHSLRHTITAKVSTVRGRTKAIMGRSAYRSTVSSSSSTLRPDRCPTAPDTGRSTTATSTTSCG